MSKVIALAVAVQVCGAVVLCVFLSAPSAEPTPAQRSPHGEFATRLQPWLDGIGSTRELAPVALTPPARPARALERRVHR
jgi:hypothetical protein